jgi:YfiH family protein
VRALDHDNLHYFRFGELPDNGAANGRPSVRHAVFSRLGGVSAAPFDSLNLSLSVPDERERVYANRRRVYGLYGRDTDTVVHAHLVHGVNVARVTQADNGAWVEHVDGLITDQPGCVLSMNFADCAPIFLYDPRRRAIGLGHAGWRGAVVDLPGAMARAMTAEFGSDPADLVAAIGPCIGPCCYEVGAEVIDAVGAAFERPELLFRPPSADGGRVTSDELRVTSLEATDDQRLTTNDKLLIGVGGRPSAVGRQFFDLPAANHHNLANAGVRTIEHSEFCTACRTDLFFSHRAEKGRTGRFGAVFALSL